MNTFDARRQPHKHKRDPKEVIIIGSDDEDGLDDVDRQRLPEGGPGRRGLPSDHIRN